MCLGILKRKKLDEVVYKTLKPAVSVSDMYMTYMCDDVASLYFLRSGENA